MAPGRVARWYEMHLLDELGQRPEVDRCVECDRVLEADERFRWVPPLGGILCERCPGPPHDRTGITPRGGQAAQGLPAPRHRGDRGAPARARGRTRDRGGPARVRPRRARTRRPLAGVPRRGPARPTRRASAGRDGRSGGALAAAGIAGAAFVATQAAKVGGRAAVGRTEARLCVTGVGPPYHASGPGARAARAACGSPTCTPTRCCGAATCCKRGTRGQVDVPRLIDGNVALQVLAATTQSPRHLNLERNDDRSDDVILLALALGWPPATWRRLLPRALHLAGRADRLAARSDGRFRVIRSRGRPGRLRGRPARATARSRPASWRSRAPTRSTATRPTSRSWPTPASG